MRGADVISILEAAYTEADIASWLDRLAKSMCPSLDLDFGVHAHAFHADRRSNTTRLMYITPSSTPASAARNGHVSRAVHQNWPLVEGVVTLPTTQTYTFAPWAGFMSELVGTTEPILHLVDASGESGVDAFGILGSEPSGEGIAVVAHAATTKRPRATERRLWTMVAVHVAAAYRIVRKRAASVDAVLRADGRVEHAEDPAKTHDARVSLRRAAKAIDRARGRLRHASPREAIELWRGLVNGTWSLVDHVDSDGKRFIFAKRNAPDLRPWRTLSPREQQVLAYAAEGHPHKLIGYELGISESTSARHLASAARKVGARSRVELLQAYRATTFPHDR